MPVLLGPAQPPLGRAVAERGVGAVAGVLAVVPLAKQGFDLPMD